MIFVSPLPIRDDWAPAGSYGQTLVKRGHGNRDFAFNLVDAQGAPGEDGRRYHAGVDWFAPGGTKVVSPTRGHIVDVVPSRGNRGQVYGGVVRVEAEDGITVVFRHVEPLVRVGQTVQPGEAIAKVTLWADAPGTSHAHIEIWRSYAGGYRYENMIDPLSVTWAEARDPVLRTKYAFEELPHTQGGRAPAIVGQKKGYAQKLVALAVLASNKLIGRKVSLLRGEDDRYYVLWWLPGTHGQKFRFGPWDSKAARDRVMSKRQENTGRGMRPYEGRNSLIPYPKEA